MSGNPFRRSSFKSPGPTINSGPGSSETLTIPLPLSLDTGTSSTKTSSQTTKHVAFRSPPALPLSPDSPESYPPSPISARISVGSAGSSGPSAPTTAFREAYPDNPFRSESSGDDDDGTLDEARQNARTNLRSYVQKGLSTKVSNNSIQTTLGKFASVQGRPSAGSTQVKDGSAEIVLKPAMDVDAFTRMLLAGASNSHGSKESPPSHVTSTQPPSASESISSTDTASISRQSIFEPLLPIPAESPRTSEELDEEGASDERQQLMGRENLDVKRRPVPPKPRHGKLIKPNMSTVASPPKQDAPGAITASPNPIIPRPQQNSDLNKPLPLPPVDNTFPNATSHVSEQDLTSADATKRPPNLPLPRRRSSQKQDFKPTVTRSTSLRQPYMDEPQMPSASSLVSLGSKVPPRPPPSRRSTGNVDRRPLADLASTSEEMEAFPIYTEVPPPPSPSGSIPRLPLPPSRRSSITQPQAQPSQQIRPPLPPPRKSRGTSRTSFDMQRPTMAMTPMPEAGEGKARPSAENSRNVSGSSNANDILADLAALQREVDAIRARGVGI